MGNKPLKCRYDTCNMTLENDKYNYCLSHKCIYYSCNNPHYYNSNYCTNHKCAKSWCNNESVLMGRCMTCVYSRYDK